MASIRMALLAVVMVIVAPLVARAAQPFESAAFEQAQEAGRTILVDVTAPWCPTCAKQKPVIEALEKEMPDLAVFEVEFDLDKDVLKRFRVQYQSTLIVFKGKTEAGRSTGETDPKAIRALVAKGM